MPKIVETKNGWDVYDSTYFCLECEESHEVIKCVKCEENAPCPYSGVDDCEECQR